MALMFLLLISCAIQPPPRQIAGVARFFPAQGAGGVCTDAPLKINFSSPPTLGSGKIEIFDAADHSLAASIDVSEKTRTRTIGGVTNYKYYPILISGNEVSIHPAAQLGYGKSYYVKIDATAFKSQSGEFVGIQDAGGWPFSTKRNPPAADAPRLMVAADGSGDFCTVQGAFDFIPAGNTRPTTVFIRKGVYTEMDCLLNKNSVTVLGEDRKQTIIQYADNAVFNPSGSPYRRGMFLGQHCNDLTIANLTMRNTTPYRGSQAETLILNGTTTAHAIVTDVDLYSFQDTLQINGQAYIRNSYIEGDVDFLWGTGPCFFENCTCRSVHSKAYYTQIRNPATNHGYVFLHCTFDGTTGVNGNFLSRIEPMRFPASEVVLIDCVETESVGAIAWRLDRGTDPAKIQFWEYNSHTPDGKPVDVAERAAFSKQLKQPEDAKAIADYSSAAFVLGGWEPKAPELK